MVILSESETENGITTYQPKSLESVPNLVKVTTSEDGSVVCLLNEDHELESNLMTGYLHSDSVSPETVGRVVPVECDVTNRDEVRALVDTALEEFGDIRVLVNNAGGSDEPSNTMHRCDDETFEWMLELNLKSQFMLSKEVLPVMIVSGGGSMVHMGSVNGLFGIGLSGYSEAKSGLLSMSRIIAAHYGQYGVRSNVISAGTIETANRREEMENTEGRAIGTNARDRWLDQYPLGRFGLLVRLRTRRCSSPPRCLASSPARISSSTVDSRRVSRS